MIVYKFLSFHFRSNEYVVSFCFVINKRIQHSTLTKMVNETKTNHDNHTLNITQCSFVFCFFSPRPKVLKLLK